MVVLTGHIDLSVGSVAGFIVAVSAVLMVRYDMHFVPAALVCLALGGLIGAAQGFWIAYFKIPSFIVTLAGMLVFKGLMIAVLGGRSLGPFAETDRKSVVQGKSGSVRVAIGCRLYIKKKKTTKTHPLT